MYVSFRIMWISLLIESVLQEACHLVERCFNRAKERNASSASACRVAASVLFRAAFTKGSNDNISVVVVDLRQHAHPDHSHE